MSVGITILRCTCGDPDNHKNEPCPQAKAETPGQIEEA